MLLDGPPNGFMTPAFLLHCDLEMTFIKAFQPSINGGESTMLSLSFEGSEMVGT
jgi:hypothetical protein